MKRKNNTDSGMNQRTVRQWLILRVVQSVQSKTIQMLYLMFKDHPNVVLDDRPRKLKAKSKL